MPYDTNYKIKSLYLSNLTLYLKTRKDAKLYGVFVKPIYFPRNERIV